MTIYTIITNTFSFIIMLSMALVGSAGRSFQGSSNHLLPLYLSAVVLGKALSLSAAAGGIKMIGTSRLMDSGLTSQFSD